jgi:23S rRNA pseudouridine1911/1915/1917 synthase
LFTLLTALQKTQGTFMVGLLKPQNTQAFTTTESGEEAYVVTHRVEQTGIRLDAFLKERYRRRSREMLKRAIDSGAIALQRNQSPHLTVGRLKASTQLIAGDEVMVVSERKPEPPVCFDYKVLYEDDTLFVIEKPANLPVHPAGRYFFNTLLVHLRTQAHSQPLKAEREFFLVHRIDKETSGILVLAKERSVCADLTRQFAERSTEKRYYAVVRGVPSLPEFEVNLAMRRSTVSRVELKMTTAPEDDGGLPAQTKFSVVSTHGDFALVECRPKTGRQHQIRVHLESAGHPIVGDKLYGLDEDEAYRFFERQFISAEAQAKLLLPRHALHACWIRFTHPSTGLKMEFNSPLPQDLREFLELQDRGNADRARAQQAPTTTTTATATATAETVELSAASRLRHRSASAPTSAHPSPPSA